MSLLSKGYKKPVTGDKALGASGWYKQIEDTIDLLNAHKHDGADGFKVNPKDLDIQSATILTASFGADLGGNTFKATVNLPTGYSMDTTKMAFQVASGAHAGKRIDPLVKKITATTYDIYLNEALDVLVIYG